MQLFTVPDKAVDDDFTEQMWDDYIKTNINNLITPPACRVTKSANQSLTSGVETTVTFDTEAFDTDAMHDTVTNNSRITVVTAGKYLVIATVVWAVNNAGGRFIRLSHRNSAGAGQAEAGDRRNAFDDSNQGAALIVNAIAGDYFDLSAYQTSGGALNVISGVTGSVLQAVRV